MRLIPYVRKQYETDLSKEAIFKRLEKIISPPDWKISIQKAANNRILEGETADDSFKLVMGGYALTYGRSSLLPVMKGTIVNDQKRLKTLVKIVIHPAAT